MREMFGERVAELRKREEMTQAELAESMSLRLGKEVSALTVTRIESGSRPTSVEELVALGEVLRVLPEKLLPSGALAVTFRSVAEKLEISYRRQRSLAAELESLTAEAEFMKSAFDALTVLREYQVGGSAAGVRQALEELFILDVMPDRPFDVSASEILSDIQAGLTPEMHKAISERSDSHDLDGFVAAVGSVIEEFADDPAS